MDFLTTLTAVEEIFLEVVDDRKQYTARCIGCSVDTVGARNSASQGSYMRLIRSILQLTVLMDIPLIPTTEIAAVTIASLIRRESSNIAGVEVQRVV